MELSDIVIAGPGFATGLLLGLFGANQKREEELDIAELIPAEITGVSNRKIRNTRGLLKGRKLIAPLWIGGAYSCLYVILTEDAGNYRKAIPLVAGAYLGQYVGGRIRRLFSNKEIIRKISRDPKNFYKYLLSEDSIKIIEQAFSEIEQLALQGADFDEVPVRILYDAIHGNKYEVLLQRWCMKKYEDVFEHADLQRKITEFYEKTVKKAMTSTFVQASTLGDLGTRVKIFTVEGDYLYVQTLEISDLKLITSDITDSFTLSGEGVRLSVSDKQQWTRDYRKLTDLVIGESKGYSRMLMHFEPGISDREKTQTTMKSYIAAFQERNAPHP